MKKQKEIAVFGGSFDPPTIVHQEIIRELLDMESLDEVWVMPSGERMDKPHTTSAARRLAMLAIMKDEVFGGDARLHISDFEIRLPQPTETIHTVDALRASYPSAQFWYVFGADSIASMHEWHNGDALLRDLPKIVVPRRGYAVPVEAAHVHELPDLAIFEQAISSTLVRERVARQQPLKGLVSQSIERCIRQQRLYRQVVL